MEAPRPHSSTTSCQDDAPQNGSRLAMGAWHFLPFPLCGASLVKFYAPLLGLQVTIANMAFHCLSVHLLGLCVLCYSSRQVGRG